MGVLGLWPFLESLAHRPADILDFIHTGQLDSTTQHPRHPNSPQQKGGPLRLGVDVPLTLTQQWMSSGSDPDCASIVNSIVRRHHDLMSCDRAPASILYVFDGERNPAKAYEHKRREDTRQAALERFQLRQTLHDTIVKQQQQASAAAAAATIAVDDTLMAKIRSTPAVRKLVENHTIIEIDAESGESSVRTDFIALAQTIRQQHKLDKREQEQADRNQAQLDRDLVAEYVKEARRPPPAEIYFELMRQFDAYGIKYAISQDEAEHYLAVLCQRGEIDVVITDDSDAFPFGAPCVLKGFSPLSQNPHCNQVYYLHDILAKHHITREQLVDACIMIGCDFTEARGLPGIGPVNAFKLVRDYKTLEAVLASPKGMAALHKLQHPPPSKTTSGANKRKNSGDDKGESKRESKEAPKTFSYKAAQSMFLNDAVGATYAS